MNPFDFLQKVDEIIIGFPQRIFGTLVDHAGQILGLMLLIYVIYVAINITIGRGKNIAEVGWDIIFLGVLFGMATVWVFMTDAVYGIFTVLPLEITGVMLGGDDITVADQLTGYWLLISNILTAELDVLSVTDVGRFLAIIILGFVPSLLLLGTATFWLVLAKFAVAVLFGLFPLFVLFAWSEKTREFFQAYLRQMFSFMLLPILIAITLNLSLRILLTVLQEFNQNSGTNFYHAMFEFAFATIVLFLLVLQMSSVASAIAGGMALGSMGAMSYVTAKFAGGVRGLKNKALRRGAGSSGIPGTNRATTDSQGRNRYVQFGKTTIKRMRSGSIKKSTNRGE